MLYCRHNDQGLHVQPHPERWCMSPVLLLNASYEPLNVVSLRRAIVLLIKDKAEILEAAEERVRAASYSMPVPLVIRLVYYVRVPSVMKIPLSRRTVMLRDNYTCQYCGAHLSRTNLTVDHVVPRMRGGQTTWQNVVCACQSCNRKKGHKSVKEAGMHLLKRPGRPQYLAMAILTESPVHQSWRKYIPASAMVETHGT